MSYGIEVLNSAGETVFNSSNYVTLACFNGTVTGVDTNVTPTGSNVLTIPDYIFGDDQHAYQGDGVDHDVYTGTFVSGGTYTSNNQIATKAVANTLVIGNDVLVYADFPVFYTDKYQLRTTANAVISEINTTDRPPDVIGMGPYNVANSGDLLSDFDNAYFIITTYSDVSSYRVAGSTLNIQKYDTSYSSTPQVYARPVSSSYSGSFGMNVDGRTISIVDHTGNNNTFEVMVCNSAEAFGSITSTTAHYLAGQSSYGLRAVTDNTQKYSPLGTAQSLLTYDSATYPVKVILANGYEPPAAGTNDDESLGSLSTSTNKRFCLMDSTWRHKNDYISTTQYRVLYQWNSNNSISLIYRSSQATGDGYFDTITTNMPFAVVEFGDGV